MVTTPTLTGCLLPLRILITIMGFFALICVYTNRVSLSHVITKLVIPINRTDDKTGEDVCPKEEEPKNDKGYNVCVYTGPDFSCSL